MASQNYSEMLLQAREESRHLKEIPQRLQDASITQDAKAAKQIIIDLLRTQLAMLQVLCQSGIHADREMETAREYTQLLLNAYEECNEDLIVFRTALILSHSVAELKKIFDLGVDSSTPEQINPNRPHRPDFISY